MIATRGNNDLAVRLPLCAPCHVPKAITSRPLHFLWQPPIIRLTSTRLPGHREPLRGDPSADHEEAKTTSPDRQDMIVKCAERLTAGHQFRLELHHIPSPTNVQFEVELAPTAGSQTPWRYLYSQKSQITGWEPAAGRDRKSAIAGREDD